MNLIGLVQGKTADQGLLDQVFEGLLDQSRSLALVHELPLLVGLIGLYLVARDSGSELTMSWDSLVQSTGTAWNLDKFCTNIERSHPKLQGVFSTLLAAAPRVPESTLKRLCHDVAKLSALKHIKQNFAYWIAFDLPKYGRNFAHRDRLSTPHGLANLMSSLAMIQDGNDVLDPSCGIGALLASVYEKATANHLKIRLYGLEIVQERWALCMLCLYFFKDAKWEVSLGDALNKIEFSGKHQQTFDRIIGDPPLGFARSAAELSANPAYQDFLTRNNKTFPSDALFVIQTLAHLRPGGRAVLLVPQGFLFRSGIEKKIREKLILEKRLEAVIALPAKRIAASSLEVALLVLGPNKSGCVRILNAAARDNPKYGQTDLSPDLIDWINATARSESTELGDDARFVSTTELASSDFILTPRRYVSSPSTQAQSFNLQATRTELQHWEAIAQDAVTRMDRFLDALETEQ